MHVSQHHASGGQTPDAPHHEQIAVPPDERTAAWATGSAPGSAAVSEPVSARAAGAGRSEGPLYVPVRHGPAGLVVRLWRTPFGSRTAVAFTSDQRLRSVLGPTQPWIKLSETALRAMAEPLGARHLTVDPLLTARPPASWAGPAAGEPLPRGGRDGEQEPAGAAP